MSPETLEMLKTVGIIAGATVGSLFLLLMFIRSFLIVGRPNEVLIFSGRKRRKIQGGRSIRWPILERVDRMDMTTIPIDIKIRGAYAKGNIPVNVDAVANAKITNDPDLVDHAVERFLGRGRNEIRDVCRETLEGTLRGVLATLTPQQINHDRQQLAEKLANEVQDDLGRMGLMVDTFKIQHVHDDVNYLDSISRIKIAEVLKDAKIAESDASRDAEQSVADATSRGKVAHENALATISEAENELNEFKARLNARASSEEERTTAAGLEARARAQQKLQQIRGSLSKLWLEAEKVIPADKERIAQELRAAGDAAIRAETGRAQAAALSALYEAWHQAGDQASEIFLIQQVDRILNDVAQVTDSLDVRRVNLIDGGDGRTLARYVAAYPLVVTEILERIKDTVGVDVAGILGARTTDNSGPPPAPDRKPQPPRRTMGPAATTSDEGVTR